MKSNPSIKEQIREMQKYSVVLSDPPWKQAKGGKKKVRPHSSGGELEYPTLSIEDIEQLHRDVAISNSTDDHILFMWTTEKYLREAEDMIKRLGYKLHARMIWNKVTGIPAAFTIRYGHDYLLYCYHGKMLPVAPEERGKIHSVFTEKVGRHSKKPEISYQIIEQLFPDHRKLEMYARQERDGWDVWGNEVESVIGNALRESQRSKLK